METAVEAAGRLRASESYLNAKKILMFARLTGRLVVAAAAAAMQSGLSKFREGGLAKAQGAGVGVREYGALLQQDHALANTQLTAIAKPKNLDAPTQLLADMTSEVMQLGRTSGKAFDTAFSQKEVAGHQKTIALF